MADREYKTTTAVTQEQAQAHSGIETGVIVPLLQNAAGALAVFLFVTTLQAVAMGGDAWNVLQTVSLWPGIVLGILVFSAATFVRSFGDEARKFLGWWAEFRNRRELVLLRTENTELRTQLKEIQDAGNLSAQYATQAAVERLLREHYQLHLPISRPEAVDKRKMDRNDWKAAHDVLVTCRVIDARSQVDPAIDEAEAWRRCVRYFNESGRWVRAADGTFTKV